MVSGEAVRAFLSAFGVPPEKVPNELDAQVGLYRSLLSDKRVLIILDNARDAEQVRPLLPGRTGTLVVVTSRDRLSGLIAQGAHPIALGHLDADDAGLLLAGRLRQRRTGAEPDATEQIIDACAGLPLALTVVAARAAANPAFPLAALAADLHEATNRFEGLTGFDPATDVRAVFSWSYRACPPKPRGCSGSSAHCPGPTSAPRRPRRPPGSLRTRPAYGSPNSRAPVSLSNRPRDDSRSSTFCTPMRPTSPRSRTTSTPPDGESSTTTSTPPMPATGW